MILIYLTIMHAVNAVQIKSNKEPKYILKHYIKIKIWVKVKWQALLTLTIVKKSENKSSKQRVRTAIWKLKGYVKK